MNKIVGAGVGSLILMAMTSSIAYSATLNVTTKYTKTGGIKGALNNTGDLINGVDVCPINPTNGCDFSDDPGFNDNGTVSNSSDDSYSGDLIVRTNDVFEVTAAWSWNNGNPGGAEETATIIGTLPSDAYEWTEIPGSCALPASNISGLTITCIRNDFDINDVGTTAEDLPFTVTVKGSTPQGTQPGDISFEVSAPNSSNVADDTDGNSLTVTSAPRWNLDKTRYTSYPGRQHNGVTGYIIDYVFLIEVDEVDGSTDNAPSALGNESMGSNATFTFTDELDQVAPNATLVGCSMDGRLDQQDGYTGGARPLSFNGVGSLHGDGTYPERKIPQAKGEQQVTCTQTGTDIAVTVTGVDATLDNAPTHSYNGTELPVNRKTASVGSIYVFVPLTDVENGLDGTSGTSDDGELPTINKLRNFDPTTPAGNSNFGVNSENEADNNYNLTLYGTRGSFNKYYRGEEAGVWEYPGGTSTYRAGDGLVTAGYEFATLLTNNNNGGTAYTEEMCDVVDAYRLEIQDLEDNVHFNIIKTHYADAYRDLTSPVMYRIWDGSGDFDVNQAQGPYEFEYSSTYVDNSWLPSRGGDQTVSHKAEVEAECNAVTGWHATADAARADAAGIGAVTKVRVKLRSGVTHPPGAISRVWLNHKVRATDLLTGQPLVNGDEITNFAANSFNGAALTGPSFITNQYPDNVSGTRGDRITFSGGKVRINKTADVSNTAPGQTVEFTLESTYTNDTGTNETNNVTIKDIMPKGLTYVAGSITGAAEPTIGACSDVDATLACNDADNQVLIWELGARSTLDSIDDIVFDAQVSSTAPAGSVLNQSTIYSPSDASAISQRQSSVGVNISVPASLNIFKSTVDVGQRERTTSGQDIDYQIDLRNGKTGSLTDLDVIDILPFIGDGDQDALNFNTIQVERSPRTDYHGSLEYVEMNLIQHPDSTSVCDLSANGGVKYYYTDVNPTTINLAPTIGNANIIGHASSIWQEGTASTPPAGMNKVDVTAVRAAGPSMQTDAICQFQIKMHIDNNLADDVYANSAGSSATGVTLPVLSNSHATIIVGSTLGNKVWLDTDADGVQDAGEQGVANVVVALLDGSGNPVINPETSLPYIVSTNASGEYLFEKLNHGDYQVAFTLPTGYLQTTKDQGGHDAHDSDTNPAVGGIATTDTITLGVDEDNYTVDAGLTTPEISGNVFNDGDGNADVNGSAISAPSGTQLHATLLDGSGTVLSTTPIAADGSYSFDGNDGIRTNSNYSVVLATSANATSSDLPTNWNNTGENLNASGSGNDGTVNGVIAVAVATADVPQIDFGINHKPVATDVVEPSQLNPGGTTQVDVPDLVVTDTEDGTPTTVTIKSLPGNATLYYDGSAVTAGQVIPNFDNTKLTVDPDNGDQTVVFPYTTTDAAGVESDPANVTMPFTELSVSGNVFNDGDGDTDVNGAAISAPSGTQLHATLLDQNGAVLATMPIAADGSYSFAGDDGVIPNTNYTVVLATTANATSSDLPTNWNNTGENLNNAGSGNDGSADGVISVAVATTDVPQIDFGINHKPVATDIVEPLRLNPGGTTQVSVPALVVTDTEDGTPTTVTIQGLPSNATLYYNGTTVTSGQVIPNFDSTLLTVDPDNGDQTVVFPYTTTDAAGVESDPATVTMPFAGLGIAGNVFNDGDGDADVNGAVISTPSGTQLHATLLDENGVVLASKPIAADGSYSFGGVDGVKPNTNYSVVLATTANATTSDLPVNWNNTGENLNASGAGNDGTADGVIAVSVVTHNIPQVDFGINLKPVAEDVDEPTQLNPGGDSQVQVPDLTVTDSEDSVPTTVTITELPTNAILYYDGTPVVAGQVINNFDNSKLTIDPQEGNLVASFRYTTTDAAGIESDPKVVTMPFYGPRILGNVFLDTDGIEHVNGTTIATPYGTQLHATLLDENGDILATQAIAADGSYSFGNADGVHPDSNYSVILATTPNATTPNLPEDWFNTGENINSAGTGNDGSKDGVIAVSVASDDVPQVDFGITPLTATGARPGMVMLGDRLWIEEISDNDGDATTGVVTGAPAGLTVTATASDGTEYTTQTDEDGNYRIEVPQNDTYVITAETPKGTCAALHCDEEGDRDVTDTTSENDKTHDGVRGTTVTVGTEDNLSIDFGYCPVTVVTGVDGGGSFSYLLLTLLGVIGLRRRYTLKQS